MFWTLRTVVETLTDT